MYKRKKLNLKVKRDFQVWLFVRILGTIMLCALVSSIILYMYTSKEIADSFFDVHLEITRVSDLLLPVILSGAAISFVSGIFLALFLPQKIAGPVYRIEQDLKKIQDGDFSKRIHLRDGDPLHDLADSINQTLDVLTAQQDKSNPLKHQ